MWDVVIALVVAMSFWASDSIVDVFKNLLAGLSGSWIRQLLRLKTPTSSSITEARQQVGPAVMTRLFELIARPLATFQTKGAFLNGLRLMAIDGTVFDVPDTETNARVFGYPGTRKGTKASFPKARLVFLVELGTHLISDALLSPYRRGLHSFKMVKEALDDSVEKSSGSCPRNLWLVVSPLLCSSPDVSGSRDSRNFSFKFRIYGNCPRHSSCSASVSVIPDSEFVKNLSLFSSPFLSLFEAKTQSCQNIQLVFANVRVINTRTGSPLFP